MNGKLLALVMLLLLLNAADIVTTRQAVALGAVELNPLMARGLEKGYAEFYKTAVLTAVVLLTTWRTRRHPQLQGTYVKMYIFFCVIYSAVVLNNLFVIARLRSFY